MAHAHRHNQPRPWTSWFPWIQNRTTTISPHEANVHPSGLFDNNPLQEVTVTIPSSSAEKHRQHSGYDKEKQEPAGGCQNDDGIYNGYLRDQDEKIGLLSTSLGPPLPSFAADRLLDQRKQREEPHQHQDRHRPQRVDHYSLRHSLQQINTLSLLMILLFCVAVLNLFSWPVAKTTIAMTETPEKISCDGEGKPH